MLQKSAFFLILNRSFGVALIIITSIQDKLNGDDYDRRLEFCEEMNQHLINNPNLLCNICLSNECTFYLHGAINRYNRYWRDVNVYLFWESHSQHPQKFNVRTDILGNNIGPLFILGNLMGEVYLDMPKNTIEPLIRKL